MAWARRSMRTCYSVEAELVLVGLVLVAWHAVRIPLEGGVAVSLAHAQDVLELERSLSLDIETAVIRSTSEPTVASALQWLYTNIHLPVLFAAMAAFRLAAPDRYPQLRTTFVLSFVPAVFVIGLYPLAPPHWLTELGLGPAPTDAQLGETTEALLHNTTAAAASQHFGFAVFVAVAAIWLFPRSRLAWTTTAYPALVFVVILGTGNHYVVDCVIGTLTFVLAASVAWWAHRSASEVSVAPRPGDVAGVAGMAVGYGLIVWGFVSLDFIALDSRENLFPDAVVLAAGIAAVLTPRLASRKTVADSG